MCKAAAAWLLVCCAASPCLAETVKPESRIVAVTVFPDRAAVTRQAALTFPDEGAYTVEIGPLPSQVEPASVTAKGAGDAEVVLYAARLVTTQLETAQDPRVQELDEAIRGLACEHQRLEDVINILAQERRYLESIQAASSEQIGKDLITKSPSASDAAAILTFLDEALLKNAERHQSAKAAMEEGNLQLDKRMRERAALAQGSKQDTRILVELEAKKGGAFQLDVSYRLPGASWQPTYEARAQASDDAVDLLSYGLVRQQTGEAWDQVQLTLSTAKPAIAGSMPELQPWWLKPWEPVYRAQAVAGTMSELKAPQAALEDKLMARKDAQVATAEVATQGPAVTFRLPKPESIPGDWQPHKVPLASQRMAATFAYETTPKLLPYAFLRANVTNTSDALYLPGEVAVFLNGAFVATASLRQVAPGETFELYLGADERVKVGRKQMKAHVEVSLLPGLRGKTKSTDYEFLTTLENFTGRKIALTVYEQLPVSEREEIVVESVRLEPKDVTKDEEKPGVFSWLLELGPTQKQELRVGYRVRYPVSLQVQE